MPFRQSEFDANGLAGRILQAQDLDISGTKIKNCISAACFLSGVLYPETYVHSSKVTLAFLSKFFDILGSGSTTSFEIPEESIVLGLKLPRENELFHMALVDPSNRSHVIEREEYGKPLVMHSVRAMLDKQDSKRTSEIVFLKNKVTRS